MGGKGDMEAYAGILRKNVSPLRPLGGTDEVRRFNYRKRWRKGHFNLFLVQSGSVLPPLSVSSPCWRKCSRE